MKTVETVYDTLLPHYQERWERGGVEMDGDIPFFPDLEIATAPKEYSVHPIYVRDRFLRRRIGSSVLVGYRMNDGLDRLAHLNLLDDKYRSDVDLTAVAGAAWTTTPHRGYAKKRDHRTAVELRIQTATVGAEGSTHERFLTPHEMSTISLAKTAQSEMMIHADLIKRYDLSSRHYARTDSRDGMEEPGRWIYAENYGIEKVFSDIRAPCAPRRIESSDVPTVAVWLGVETLGGAAVAAALVAERNIDALWGTFDVHPTAVNASLEGIMPALMTGEAGRLAELAPDHMQAHLLLYGRDILSPDDVWREIYAPKPGVIVRSAPRGSHANLLTRTGLQHARLARAVLSLTQDRQLDTDFVINGHRPGYQKQAALQLVVNQ